MDFEEKLENRIQKREELDARVKKRGCRYATARCEHYRSCCDICQVTDEHLSVMSECPRKQKEDTLETPTA